MSTSPESVFSLFEEEEPPGYYLMSNFNKSNSIKARDTRNCIKKLALRHIRLVPIKWAHSSSFPNSKFQVL
jgi:hypothetical protein